MFRFEEAGILYLIVLLPIIVLVAWLTLDWKKKVIDRYGDAEVVRRLFPDWSLKMEYVKTALFTLAILLSILAWSNPQWGSRKQKVKAKSTDVVIALDISQSMMAEDILPNRMEKAKRFCTELLKKLKGERVGLVFFAGSAYLQMPLSQDLASAELYIKSASPRQAGTQGTVIADAIELSNSLFEKEKATQRALVVISDGENHEVEAIQAARDASENGTFVFTVGVGTEEGGSVPVIDRGRTVYKRDKSGNPVKSSLNVSMLQDIAENGGGNFYMIDQTLSALKKLDVEIDKLEKQETEQRSFTDFNSYFQIFLFPAIILFLLEWLLPNKSQGKSLRRRIIE